MTRTGRILAAGALPPLFFTSSLKYKAYHWNVFTLTDISPTHTCYLASYYHTNYCTLSCQSNSYSLSSFTVALLQSFPTLSFCVQLLTLSPQVPLHHLTVLTSCLHKGSPPSLSLLKNSWCTGAPELGWIMNSHDAPHRDTTAHIAGTVVQMADHMVFQRCPETDSSFGFWMTQVNLCTLHQLLLTFRVRHVIWQLTSINYHEPWHLIFHAKNIFVSCISPMLIHQ